MDFNSEGENIIFPRTRHLNTSYEAQDKNISPPIVSLDKNCTLPSYSKIKNILHCAKQDAFHIISMLGMKVDIKKADDIQIRNLSNTNTIDGHVFNEEQDEKDNLDCEDFSEMSTINSTQQTETEEECDTEVLQDLTILSNVTETLELQDYAEAQANLHSESPFTVVKDSQGKEHVVRKSSICWLFNTKVSKLSSDRLQRVRSSEYEKNVRSTITRNRNCTITSEEVSIGDWCLFQTDNGDGYIVGLVLSFAYMTGQTWRSIEYSNNFANVSGNKKQIGVLCHWFDVDNNGNLTLLELAVHGYLPIERYRLTLPYPIFTEIGVRLSNDIYTEIKDRLKNRLSTEI